MQSRPSPNDLETFSDTNASEATTLTIQHGLEYNSAPSPPLSSADEGGGVRLPSATVHETGQTETARPLPAHVTSGLSPPLTPSSASRNRIAEYESARISSAKAKAEGPTFDVIKTPRKPGDKRSPISDLPNEILTHALAHLSPTDLSSISLVSRRFHQLVTTPHAWRTAFSRFFPGPDSILAVAKGENDEEEEVLHTERRAFARVTALASWRSEYILRTRLLRSLARGKPVQAIASPSASRNGQGHTATPIIMYNSQLFTTINHLHATFGNGLNKRVPRFVHGADDMGTASSSDPAVGKVDSWGLGDPSTFIQFSDRFPGDAQYGLGPGELVGVPNVMDVSQPHGMVHGEGMPDGQIYYRSAEEMRGRFLAASLGISAPELGIPKVLSTRESQCSVWMAKSSTIPSLTDGAIGIMAGTSLGVLTTYSLGPLGAKDQRFGRGEVTARWVLCPGVPIIAISVDDQYSMKRQNQNRIWAVVLNALGEVYYLTKFPQRHSSSRVGRIDDEARESAAWAAGRSVYWNIVEPTRRTGRPDPYGDMPIDGSYSPRTSWNGMCLDKNQVKSETREIEAFLNKKPKDFQKTCLRWDMRRRLEVDFAGDDGNNAGESVIVLETGLDEDTVAAFRRFTRCRVQESTEDSDVTVLTPSLTDPSSYSTPTSLFGSRPDQPGLNSGAESDQLDSNHSQGNASPRLSSEEWRSSTFTLGGLKSVQITSVGIDCSTFAVLTTSEDPLLSFTSSSETSSPSLTPLSPDQMTGHPADVPGQRARFLAVGTKLGNILIWNMRAPISRDADITNEVEPVRIIHTDSPQISCLALSALYLVHGGNDGLVQAWDPLASSTTPIRTLNSRFSSRARRRLVQAQASPQGVGINLFAAGAICLDPDPTVLRGMVSLGTHLRYWSYSSSAADQYRSQKRRLRRSGRGSNSGGERLAGLPRGNIKNFIANEKFELDLEHERQRREADHLAGRFGTEILGEDASEEELLAYAALLSQESLARDAQRRQSVNSVAASGAMSSSFDDHVSVFSEQSPPRRLSSAPDNDVDADMAEAIRQSLALSSSPKNGIGFEAEFNIPVRHAKPRNRKSPRRSSPLALPAEGSTASEDTDLEFAMQLSLAEEQSRRESGAQLEGAFPSLTPTTTQIWLGNGKGKDRAD